MILAILQFITLIGQTALIALAMVFFYDLFNFLRGKHDYNFKTNFFINSVFATNVTNYFRNIDYVNGNLRRTSSVNKKHYSYNLFSRNLLDTFTINKDFKTTVTNLIDNLQKLFRNSLSVCKLNLFKLPKPNA